MPKIAMYVAGHLYFLFCAHWKYSGVVSSVGDIVCDSFRCLHKILCVHCVELTLCVPSWSFMIAFYDAPAPDVVHECCLSPVCCCVDLDECGWSVDNSKRHISYIAVKLTHSFSFPFACCTCRLIIILPEFNAFACHRLVQLFQNVGWDCAFCFQHFHWCCCACYAIDWLILTQLFQPHWNLPLCVAR